MTITFSGLGSGMDTASWVEALVAAKQTSITTLESKVTALNTRSKNLTSLKSVYTSFNTILNKLADSKINSTSDVFGQSKATSSNENVLKVTSSGDAVNQTFDVFIDRLATSSVATGSKGLGKEITEDTKFSDLANGYAKGGSFSFYVDNQRYNINIGADDTLADVKNQMTEVTKSDANPDGLISVNIQDGKFSIDAGTHSLALGSSQDKSNFISVLALKKTDGTNAYASSSKITDLNLNAKILGEGSPFGDALQEGTFKVGDATFTIDENTTLGSLMSKINSSTDAGVEARINSLTGKMEFTAKSTGAFAIGMENGTSNFLELAGLTSGNKLADGTQKLGENALLSVNGKPIESFSNTVTSETSGLAGIVLNLNDVTETGKAVKVKVEQDNNAALSAVKDFISGYNNVVSKTKDLMASDSGLKHEIALTSMRSGLRSAISNTTSDGEYKTLMDIGISTGKIGTSVEANTSELVLDEAKFLEALAKDPEAVKKLLVGDDSSCKGVVTEVQTIVNDSLRASEGYFATKSESVKKQITSLNDQITRKYDSLEVYRNQITKQFNSMDATIAKLNQQFSSISGMFS